MITISSADNLAPIMKNTKSAIDKSSVLDLVKDWLGDATLLTKYEKWKVRRRMLTPAFHFNMIKNFFPIMNKHTFHMATKMRNKIQTGDNHSVDLHQFITLTALDIISEAAMGISMNSQTATDSKSKKYVEAIYWMNRAMLERIRKPILYSNFIYRILYPIKSREYFRKLEVLLNYTSRIISSRLQQRKISKVDNDKTFIDILLDEYELGNIDKAGIREEVDTFMFEGHDTTSSAMLSAFYVIAKNRKVRGKLETEVDTIFKGNTARDVTEEDLNEMPYLDAFLKEVLRLYPPVPQIARQTTGEVRLNDEHVVPANSTIALNIYSIHRDPKYWGDDFEEFKPERFFKAGV